jgi:hypothetical protein
MSLTTRGTEKKVMCLAGPGTKNQCAGEGQQQITKPDKSSPSSSSQASEGSPVAGYNHLYLWEDTAELVHFLPEPIDMTVFSDCWAVAVCLTWRAVASDGVYGK